MALKYPPAFLERLRVRAGHQCEYCHGTDFQSYEVDHVQPRARGGTSDFENLAIACPRCNANKGDHTDGVDPYDWKTYPLFNPRTDRWSTHFEEIDAEVVGISGIGRATARRLFRVTGQATPHNCGGWGPLQLIEGGCLRRYYESQRFYRLQNRFSRLLENLRAFPNELRQDKTDAIVIARLARLLTLETYFTRSSLLTTNDGRDDLDAGIQLARGMVKSPHGRLAALEAISALRQQQATIAFLDGSVERARELQMRSAAAFSEGHQWMPIDFRDIQSPESLALQLRGYVRRHGYVFDSHLSATEWQWCAHMIADSSQREHLALVSLADLELTSSSISRRRREWLFARLSMALKSSGYGTTVDVARTVVLRRRWLALGILLGEVTNEVVSRDFGYWSRVEMFNESRALKAALRKQVAMHPRVFGRLRLPA
jgi:hypothetical protein